MKHVLTDSCLPTKCKKKSALPLKMVENGNQNETVCKSAW